VNATSLELKITFLVIVSSTSVTVILVFQFNAVSFVMPWPTTISAVSAVISISLRITLISAVLSAILKSFILTSSGLVTDHPTISALSLELATNSLFHLISKALSSNHL
jgi:hypothetical protein